MKKLTRLLVVALFAALIVGSVTSFKVAATNGTGACANCDLNATVKKCNGSAAETTFEQGVTSASGNCISAEGSIEQEDTDQDGDLEDVNCVITKFYTCQAVAGGADQGCGLTEGCGGS